jgi:hypothetical protein
LGYYVEDGRGGGWAEGCLRWRLCGGVWWRRRSREGVFCEGVVRHCGFECGVLVTGKRVHLPFGTVVSMKVDGKGWS